MRFINSFKKPRLLQVKLLSLALVVWVTAAIGQTTVTISGRIIDSATTAPINGVNIVAGSSKKGIASDANGNFKITVPAGSMLNFSSTGYQSYSFVASKDEVITVILATRSVALTDVVVIGYGERRKKDITGAVASVGADAIQKSSSLTPELALQGRAAGVFVGSGGGSPNARQNIRIRGVNTFNGLNDPLYIIDGIPLTEGGAGISGGLIGDIRGQINIFSLINPADIESMSVLKDASAAAIYGVRAANGVVIITTKRGKSGKPRVEFNASYGSQNIAKNYKTLTTSEYVALYREAYANNPNAGQTFEQVFGPTFDQSSSQYLGNNPTYNWQDELLNKGAALQSYNVKLSGANDNTNYYFSAGYDYQESPLKANDQKRYSFATNVNSKISKYIEAGINTRLVYSETFDNTGADLGIYTAPPWQPIYSSTDPSGFAPTALFQFVANPAYNPANLDPGPRFNFAPGYPQLLWGPQTRYNPFAGQVLNDNDYLGYRALGNAYVQIQPITGLRIKGSIGGDYYYSRRKTWNLYDAFRFLQTPSNPYSGHDGTSVGRYTERDSRNMNLVKEITVNYSKVFAERHSVDVIVGGSEQTYKWEFSQMVSNQVNSLALSQRNIGNNPPFNGVQSSVISQYALLGFVGRLSYKYNDRYMLDVTVRRDGSSRFAPENRWGTFPAVAVGWRISGEKFMQKINWINDLKIRANWGQLGNEQNTGGFAYLSGVNLTPDYPIGSGNGNPFGLQTQGARLPNFPNRSLSWETLTTKGVGFDAVLFKNKINLTVEYYNKLNEDIIQTVGVPPSTGIEFAPDLNVASVRNSGIEFSVGYNEKFGDVRFNASANFTTVKNEVVKLNDDAPIGGEFGRIEKGMSMFYLWGYKFGGIFQTQAEINAWRQKYADITVGQDPNNPGAGYQPKVGDAYFLDVNGNPKVPGQFYSPFPDSLINANDRTYLGRTIPGYYYGFNFGAEWKGFDVSIFFQGVGNVQKYNFQRANGEGMSSNGANQWATVLNRWTPSNPSTTMPRAAFGDPNANNRTSSRFVENAGFLRLKNLQIGYTVPKNLLTKTGFISNVRVYFSGINLATFTKWTGLDPEVDGIPPTRQIIFGINASF
jgi:TonB-linked SusC/RagA family outer membrane protein